jgi:CO dehydrogenase maturation factor
LKRLDMKIAVAGKGGSGKTTIAGTLARLIARRGHEVWAIDADSNPNLGLTLGLSREQTRALMPMPKSILEDGTDEEGKRKVRLGMPPGEVAERFGVATPDSVRLLVMGRIDHAGAG